MDDSGQWGHADVKVVPHLCITALELQLSQYTSVDEFTNCFSNSKRDAPILFEATAVQMSVRHKRILPYTPRRSGKAERNHRENQKRFYSCHSFYSLDDFAKQLAAHNRRSNNFPMKSLGWLSPVKFVVQYV